MAFFRPTWSVKAIYGLTPESLRKHGIKAILTDLDNTLIAWNNPDGTPELRRWLNSMQDAGITVMVVSNNNHNRIAHALRHIQLPFVSRALKPLPVGINRALKQLKLNKDAVVMVGDQLMTDMIAGNVAGIRTILVAPIVETDAWNTQLNRLLEKVVFLGLGKRVKDYQEDIYEQR